MQRPRDKPKLSSQLFSAIAPFLTIILPSVFISPSAMAEKITYAELKPGDVITVSLDQLLPTQSVLAYDNEYSNLGRYAENLKFMYDDLCRLNGAKGIEKWTEDSLPTDIASYQCIDKPGEHIDDLSTVVVGPEKGVLYLTNNHHILSTFWDMPNGGTSVPVTLKVEYNLLASGDDFWPEMLHDKAVWLYDSKGEKIKPKSLPGYLGTKQLKHDPFLSLVYFLKGISYETPKKTKKNKLNNEPSFLELYWSQILRQKMNISEYDLNVPEQYAIALTEAATIMVDLDSDTIIGKSNKTAKEMGQLSQVNARALDALLTDSKSKWHYAMAYRLEKKEKSTPKSLLDDKKESAEESAKEKDKTAPEEKEVKK
ncbi:ParB/Srx family N-terminal domain-containing protein [Photobacterium sp.]|uniref:ParB/Srx family N-terminal domain-containing protein n=1 Tax=Photobacterium sp. TaxID=660 RepID=UPI00299F52B8|nr:ParB/Srx family N-terminal domain-containing protein [Photobacterium sp.]MDX1301702.1 ParB/Srx family N-terminal domain-containing protein [Photobacterium sp.]